MSFRGVFGARGRHSRGRADRAGDWPVGPACALGARAGDIGALSEPAPPGFVGSAACADCHAAETRAWLSSQHAHAMARAEPQTALGNFEDARVTHRGSAARFVRDGPRYMVKTEGAESHPL